MKVSTTKSSLLVVVLIISIMFCAVVLYNLQVKEVVIAVVSIFNSVISAIVGYYFRASTTTSESENKPI